VVLTTLVTECPDLKSLDAIEPMKALDTMTYLPDDILTKIDRANGRITGNTGTFLDHRVVEFAWQLL
jgi:asparagine synthase (glutamine-hydrolysing)